MFGNLVIGVGHDGSIDHAHIENPTMGCGINAKRNGRTQTETFIEHLILFGLANFLSIIR